MRSSLARAAVATEGNKVSSDFQPADKSPAVRCWQAAVDYAAVDDKVLAAECRISRSYYSKLASGQQGDLFELVYRLPAHRASIRADFFARLAESEGADAAAIAAEQLTAAAIRYLRLAAVKRPRMVKAGGR